MLPPRSFDEGGLGKAGGGGEEGSGKTMALREVVAWMRAADVLVGVHGSGLINGLFMRSGSVVIDLLCPGFTELTFASSIYAAGSHYLFLPNTNRSSAAPSSAAPVPQACLPPRTAFPTDAAKYECMPIRNCDLEVDVAALDGLARQAALLVRLHKRRVARDISLSSGLFHRGRLPNGDVEPLHDYGDERRQPQTAPL